MAGTFRIHHTTIFALGPGWTLASGTTYNTDATVATRTLDSFAGDTLELDGIDVGGINDVPPGFKVLSATWGFKAFNNPLVGGMPASRVSTGSDGSDNQAASGSGGNTYFNSYPGTITAIELFTDELHAEFDVTGNNKKVQVILGDNISDANFLIGGAYDIVNFSFTVDPQPAVLGDTITVGATDALDEVDEIHITYIDPVSGEVVDTTVPQSAFLTQTPTEITFILSSAYVPSDFAGDVMLWGVGNGTQFSGTIALGVLAILIENGSGLYRLVARKTNDTVYISSATGDDTQDVAFPDPFFQTGYVGG